MKLPILGFVLLMVGACSQQAEPVDEAEAAVEGAPDEATDENADAADGDAEAGADADGEDAAEADEEEAAKSPVETCEALVSAAKEGDAETFSTNATDAAVEAMSQNEELAKSVMGTMGEATCGEANVEDDVATVSAAIGDTTRDIPFAMVEGEWKFDGAAYMEKYPMDEAGKKGKKGKKGRKKRKRKG